MGQSGLSDNMMSPGAVNPRVVSNGGGEPFIIERYHAGLLRLPIGGTFLAAITQQSIPTPGMSPANGGTTRNVDTFIAKEPTRRSR